jgi:type III secretory pathway component EscV
MAPTASDVHSDRPFPHLHPAPEVALVTDARRSASMELSSRMRRYTVAMAFRLACFVGMAFVDGWLRWTLLAFAVFLPYVAVVLANQTDQRSMANRVEHGGPEDAPALTTGDEGVVTSGEVISGEVVDDTTDEYARPAA